MMIAHNDRELNDMLIAELAEAMAEASEAMMKDMEDGVKYFYDGGTPIMYHRTNALGNTPEVTPVRVSGNTMEFEVYLNQDHVYNTGKNPTMHDVLDLANYGKTMGSVGRLRPTVGHKAFWEKSEDAMSRSFEKIMKKHFG